MKLTNPETIQESEKDFIDTINAELDWEAIEKMLLEKHSFTLQEEIDYKDGDLIVHNDDIAYKFDFEIKVPLSVIFNRQGDCLDISTVRDDFDEDDDDLYDLDETDPEEESVENTSEKERSVKEELVQDGSIQEDLVPSDGEHKDSTASSKKDEKVAQMASNIADMISEINQGDE